MLDDHRTLHEEYSQWRLFIEEYGERGVQSMSNFVAARMSFHRALVISHESWPMIIDRAAWTSWSFRGFLKTYQWTFSSIRQSNRTLCGRSDRSLEYELKEFEEMVVQRNSQLVSHKLKSGEQKESLDFLSWRTWKCILLESVFYSNTDCIIGLSFSEIRTSNEILTKMKVLAINKKG